MTKKTCVLDPTVWHKHWVGWFGKTFYERQGNRICKYTVRNDYVWRSYQTGWGDSGWAYSRLKPEGIQLNYPYNRVEEETDG